jgi:hypothetical protein
MKSFVSVEDGKNATEGGYRKLGGLSSIAAYHDGGDGFGKGRIDIECHACRPFTATQRGEIEALMTREGVSITYSNQLESCSITIDNIHAEWFDDLYQAISEAMHDDTLTPEELAVEAHHKEIDRRRRAERANPQAS